MKLKLDLHDIYNRGVDIDRALNDIIAQAVAKRAPLVEIIPGKLSGEIKMMVLRVLVQKEIKALYHRVEMFSDIFWRVFVLVPELLAHLSHFFVISGNEHSLRRRGFDALTIRSDDHRRAAQIEQRLSWETR